MANLTYAEPVVNSPNSSEDPKIVTALTQLATFGNKFAWGTSTMTFPFSAGSRYSAYQTITHGLASAPSFVVVMLDYADAYASVVGSPTSTTFQALGNAVTAASITGTFNLWWLAIV